MDRITIPRLTDAHVHLRQGEMIAKVAPYTARVCANCVVMPNTDPPVHSDDSFVEAHAGYRAALGPDCWVGLTGKLLPQTTPEDVLCLHRLGAVGMKLYPCGVTTNSDDGIPYSDIEEASEGAAGRLQSVLACMAEIGMPLLCHGESTGFVTDRETQFLYDVYLGLVRNFPDLKITLEHVTTAEAVGVVKTATRANPGRLLATITLHHLEITLNDVIGGHLRPDLFCKPVPKKTTDRTALIDAALSGQVCFALGSDSAPHAPEAKYGPCGCAGVFSAPVLAEGIVSLWDKHAGLANDKAFERLTAFTSGNANRFYGFQPSNKPLVFERKPFAVPPVCGGVVSYRSGEILPWSLVEGE